MSRGDELSARAYAELSRAVRVGNLDPYVRQCDLDRLVALGLFEVSRWCVTLKGRELVERRERAAREAEDERSGERDAERRGELYAEVAALVAKHGLEDVQWMLRVYAEDMGAA